jgi:hypothetical protein
MTERSFPEENISVEGNPIKAMRICCAHCGAVGYYPFQAGNRRRPPIAAQQYFQNKGWVVGSNPRKDFCPLHGRPNQRKAKQVMTTHVAKPAPVAEPPRECTREDRRIIMEKLDEVYGKDCYKAPWTDAAVAKDLGVPRDWVTRNREEFFGPAGSNPLFEEYLAARDHVESQIKGLAARYEAALAAVEKYKAEFEQVSNRVAELRLLGKRIEREIGR